jgi:phosphatidylinositol 4-kinase
MDGADSDMFHYFTQVLFRGFTAIRPHVEEFVQIIQVMQHESDLPCFKKFNLKEFRDRFKESLTMDEVYIQYIYCI